MNANRSDHESVKARLDDLVDGQLSDRTRREVEGHLETCAACRATVATRRELSDEIATLPRSVEPSRELWPDIRSRLEEREARGRAGSLRALAAAATGALVAGAAALTLWLSADGDPTEASRAADRGASAGDDPVALVADWRSFEREYAGAAEELQETLDELGNELSPETRRIVERNLDVIDAAIAESRAALEGDPANWELARALRSAWSSKVEMLQYVTRL